MMMTMTMTMTMTVAVLLLLLFVAQLVAEGVSGNCAAYCAQQSMVRLVSHVIAGSTAEQGAS
jgi:hypothetical protein